MYSFNRSLPIANLAVTIIALAVLLSPAGNAESNKPKGLRTFYVTKTMHTGSQALTACAEGYHMASLWEILDPSNLRYNTELGVTTADSGFGPPSSNVGLGWVRTGFVASDSGVNGQPNCDGWTSSSDDSDGTIVFLSSQWDSFTSAVSTWWAPGPGHCSSQLRVWCVQN